MDTHDLVKSFLRCNSEPSGLDMGTKFAVERNRDAKLDCQANHVGKYDQLVLTGDDLSICPAVKPIRPPVKTLTHALDVAIVP